jgi:hypothetical protein
MSERTEKVHEFRGVIEAVLAANTRRIESGPGRPVGITSYKKEARFDNLTYTSLDQRDARLNAFGFSESHLWGVASPLRILGRTAFMSIHSTEDRDDSLFRRFTINSAKAMFPVDTQIELDGTNQIDDAVNWARTPHLSDDAFSRLAVIQPDEIEAIQPRLEELAQSQAELQEALDALDKNRRQAEIDSRDIIIY